MPYGCPSSSGHGYRPTRYRWTPSFDPVSPRRKRRRSSSHPAQRPTLPAPPARASMARFRRAAFRRLPETETGIPFSSMARFRRLLLR